MRHGDKEVGAEAGEQRIEDNASPSCIRPDLFVAVPEGNTALLRLHRRRERRARHKKNTLIKLKTCYLFIIVITTASNNRY